jgi:hypothetical protein
MAFSHPIMVQKAGTSATAAAAWMRGISQRATLCPNPPPHAPSHDSQAVVFQQAASEHHSITKAALLQLDRDELSVLRI